MTPGRSHNRPDVLIHLIDSGASIALLRHRLIDHTEPQIGIAVFQKDGLSQIAEAIVMLRAAKLHQHGQNCTPNVPAPDVPGQEQYILQSVVNRVLHIFLCPSFVRDIIAQIPILVHKNRSSCSDGYRQRQNPLPGSCQASQGGVLFFHVL